MSVPSDGLTAWLLERGCTAHILQPQEPVEIAFTRSLYANDVAYSLLFLDRSQTSVAVTMNQRYSRSVIVFSRYWYERAAQHFFPADPRLDEKLTRVATQFQQVQVDGKAHVTQAVKTEGPVVVGPGAVIGRPGFGFAREGKNIIRHQHSGVVTLGAGVEVGANACIDRAMFDATTIGHHVKLDNLVHVAHNVTLGDRVCIAANTTISGHAQVGEDTWIGPNVFVKEGVRIGKNALIGGGSVVVSDVPDNEVWCGNPARKLRERLA